MPIVDGTGGSAMLRFRMSRKVAIRLVALIALVIALSLLALIFLRLASPPAPAPLPNPNGYDDFRTAAAQLVGDPGNASTLDHDSLQALVSTNAESLRLVRLGLSRQCALPADSAMANVPGMLSQLADEKRLAQLLAAEGRLAEMDNRAADAARSYVDAIRFGNEISRGGFIIVRLVGVACEAIGQQPLTKLAPKLNPAEARQVMIDLEKVDQMGVTWAEILRNENRFAHYQLGKGLNPFVWVVTRPQAWRARRVAETRHKRIVAHLRLLTLELALRVYQAGQGRAPASLDQLIPQYLQRVPTDPFSGKPLIYRPQPTRWLLYSVGEDAVDDGGKPVVRSVSGKVTKGDIFYDSPY